MEDFGYTKDKKKIMLCIDDRVRVVQYDNRNLELQVIKEIQRKTGELELDWVFKAYVSTMMDALNYIVTRDVLVDYESISKIEDYYSRCEEVKKTILKAIKTLG